MTAAKLFGLLLLSAALWVSVFLVAGLMFHAARCAGVVSAPRAAGLHTFDAPPSADRGVACR